MSKRHWKERYGNDGICDFKANYDYFFKWLMSKTCSCFYFENLPESMDEFYIKSSLLCDGNICITDFNSELYAVLGAPGGKPDEYYRPTVYTVANPILGSKVVNDNENGIIIYNTPTDAYVPGGIYGLIAQTATLLADNIVSINCCQINSRVSALITADSEAQAMAGENIMKNIYAGKPFKILRSDLIEKIGVNPIANSQAATILTELIELHNYIISNYFQSIGIRANNIRKKAHMLQDEIDVQNEFLQISIYEILTSWQAGFDRVNKMYGTDIKVHINPALLPEVLPAEYEPTGSESAESESAEAEPAGSESAESESAEAEPAGSESAESESAEAEPTGSEPDESDPAEIIKEQEETITEIVDIINDESAEVVEDAENSEGD